MPDGIQHGVQQKVKCVLTEGAGRTTHTEELYRTSSLHVVHRDIPVLKDCK